jgi:hypothetical protein
MLILRPGMKLIAVLALVALALAECHDLPPVETRDRAYCAGACDCKACLPGHVCTESQLYHPAVHCVDPDYEVAVFKHLSDLLEPINVPVNFCTNAIVFEDLQRIDQGQPSTLEDTYTTGPLGKFQVRAPQDVPSDERDIGYALGCEEAWVYWALENTTVCRCGRHTDCESCLADADIECGWCFDPASSDPSGNGTCMPVSATDDCPVGYEVAELICPTALAPACDTFTTCGTCLAEAGCGWCASTCCCTAIPAEPSDAVCYDFDNMFLLATADCPENRLISLAACRANYTNQEILFELYSATNGGAWINADPNWTLIGDAAFDVCTLAEVTCNGDGTQITDLDLTDHGLDGVLPESLGCLEFMQYLTIAGNPNLGGLVPSTLVHHLALKNLMLSNNNLSGPLPPELGELFDAMQYFYAAGNHLGCELPASYGDWQYLREIHLEENCFRGDIPTEYASWASNDNFEEAHFECNAALADPSAAFQAQFAADELYIPSVTSGCSPQTDCQFCAVVV